MLDKIFCRVKSHPRPEEAIPETECSRSNIIIYPSVYPSVRLSICACVRLSVCMPVRLSIHPSVGPSVHLYVTSSVEKKIITLRPVAFRFQYSFCRSRIGFDRQKILSFNLFLPKLFQNSKNDFRCASLFSELIPQHKYIFLYAILFFCNACTF